MCGSIAQVVERRTSNMEVTGSNSLKPEFFLVSFFAVSSMANSLQGSFVYFTSQLQFIYTCINSFIFFTPVAIWSLFYTKSSIIGRQCVQVFFSKTHASETSSCSGHVAFFLVPTQCMQRPM